VASLNPCLDAILMEVADPGQIAALSWYSRDPRQFAFAERAKAFRHIRSDAEEVSSLRPDLVLIGGFGTRELTQALATLHIAHVDFTVPETIEQSVSQIRQVAAAVGHADRGEALVIRIRAALRAAAPDAGEPRPTALVFEAQGFASGPGTLMDELLGRAGFRNVASRYGLKRSGEVSVERLVADPPDVLLAGRLDPGEPAWADRTLSHPALARLAGRMRREAFPEPLLFCAGPVLIPAVAALARARRHAEGLPR
jgi:iron complex transport system substrate-binding protein